MAGDDFDLVAHIQDLQRNSESGSALVTVALVDEWLEKLLLTAMRELSNTVATRLFETGPLQSFAAKADIAFAFRLIDAGASRGTSHLTGCQGIDLHTLVYRLVFRAQTLMPFVRNCRGGSRARIMSGSLTWWRSIAFGQLMRRRRN